MNKEIKLSKKEIIGICEFLKIHHFENAYILLDYITNLQQRCEYLERSNNRREDTILGLRQEIYEQEDYKYRCEKASEYFKYQLENLDFYEDTKARMLCAMGIALLQNGSDDNE